MIIDIIKILKTKKLVFDLFENSKKNDRPIHFPLRPDPSLAKRVYFQSKTKTKYTPLYDDEVYVECEDNFTEEERNIIEEFEVTNVKEFIEHPEFSREQKHYCLRCYKYVKETYEQTGNEPIDAHSIVTMKNLFVVFRVLRSGLIKYCSLSSTESIRL